MAIETGSLHPQPGPSTFDTNWYPRITEHGAFEAFEYYKGDEKGERAQQKQRFLKSIAEENTLLAIPKEDRTEEEEIRLGMVENYNPTLDYPFIDESFIREKEQGLLELEQAVKREELGDPESREGMKKSVATYLYERKIWEKLAEVRMLRATQEGDMELFRMLNDIVYGKPNFPAFRDEIISLRERLLTNSIGDTDEIQALKISLLYDLPEYHAEDRQQLPTQEEVDIFAYQTHEELKDLVALTAADTVYDAKGIKAMFEHALSVIEAHGWNVVIDENAKNISVSQDNKRVVVPQGRQLRGDEIIYKIIHEIGSHVKRRSHGERTDLQLLGIGLAEYNPGEEGVATGSEQAVRGEVTEFANPERVIAVGLGYGHEGDEKRTFRQVFQILEKYFALEELQAGKESETSWNNAQNKAWDLTVRVFRGSDCKTPGAVYTKDKDYNEGARGIWRVVAEDPKLVPQFRVGKYNPANSEHVEDLRFLGIIE